MRVTVVVPAHDAETTLGRAVRSALDQSCPPDEVLVVDDGSTDGTAAAATAFGPPVRLVSRPQGGPSVARNTGVAAAGGEWVAFLDADDQWHHHKLERQLESAADDVVLVATDWSRQLRPGPAPVDVPRTTVGTDDLVLLNRFQTSTVLLRRRVLLESGGFDPSLDGIEDWDMWLRASRFGAVVKLDWPFVAYADTEAGYSKQLTRVYRTGAEMLGRLFGDHPDSRQQVVLAWHHLRFAVAYLLDGDRRRAASCLAECRRAGLLGAVPEAALRHLLPFLAARLTRRLRGRLPGRRMAS
ncbi:MAG: glycosyltransferase family 2 protein [Acidimicrobiales bacterium]